MVNEGGVVSCQISPADRFECSFKDGHRKKDRGSGTVLVGSLPGERWEIRQLTSGNAVGVVGGPRKSDDTAVRSGHSWRISDGPLHIAGGIKGKHLSADVPN